MNQLTLSFFGPFQATVNKPISNFRSVKIQGLLIYLVLTPQQTHDRDRLATLFWPDEPDKTAKRNLAYRSIDCANCWGIRMVKGRFSSSRAPPCNLIPPAITA